MEKDKELAVRRTHAEMKEIKETLAKEVKIREKVMEERDGLKKELEEKSEKYAGKSERFLARRAEELDLENRALKESILRVTEEINRMFDKIKEKD